MFLYLIAVTERCTTQFPGWLCVTDEFCQLFNTLGEYMLCL